MTLRQPSFPTDDRQRTAPSHDAAIPKGASELITYIIERFHNGYRRDMPSLVVLARKVESVHGDHPEAPKGLADFLDEVAESLDEHMQKEERILFSMLKGGGHPTVSRLIAMMRLEHDDHASNLDNILALTNGLKVPERRLRFLARAL
jgi:regulator of cell morphogenesis and NO signaling